MGGVWEIPKVVHFKVCILGVVRSFIFKAKYA
jgi:hypothetical protein